MTCSLGNTGYPVVRLGMRLRISTSFKFVKMAITLLRKRVLHVDIDGMQDIEIDSCRSNWPVP